MSVSLNQSDDFHLQPKILWRFGSQWLRDVFTFVLENPKDGCLWKHIFLIYLVCIVNAGLHHWGPSPIFVVDNHIYQHAQRSGELGWIWRQLHSWRTTSLPFDLFTRFLSGLRLFLPIVIALTLLQTHVLLHLLRGSDLSCVRLQAEGATVGTWNRFTEMTAKVTLNVCTETPPSSIRTLTKCHNLLISSWLEFNMSGFLSRSLTLKCSLFTHFSSIWI